MAQAFEGSSEVGIQSGVPVSRAIDETNGDCPLSDECLEGTNMPTPDLVTGAAGRVGGVGRTVTELLLKQGKRRSDVAALVQAILTSTATDAI